MHFERGEELSDITKISHILFVFLRHPPLMMPPTTLKKEGLKTAPFPNSLSVLLGGFLHNSVVSLSKDELNIFQHETASLSSLRKEVIKAQNR